MLLGLDVGTTALKAVVLDPERGIVAAALAAHDTASPAPVVVGGRPGARGWPTRSRSCPRCARRPAIAPGDVAAVGVAGCVPCVLLLDARRRPLRPALLYNDAPRRAEIDELRAELGAEACWRAPARASRSSRSGPSCAGSRATSPSVVAATRRIAGSYDWLAGRLAGAALHASATGRSRAASTTWSTAGSPTTCWPRPAGTRRCCAPIRDPGDVVGGCRGRRRRRAPACAAGTPVVAGLRRPRRRRPSAPASKAHGEVLVKLGGSVDVLARSDRPLVDARLYLDAHPRPGPVAAERLHGHRRLGDPLVPARARRRRAARRSSTPRRRPPPAGADGLVILPYLLGEKTPLQRPARARRARRAAASATTRGHLFRGAARELRATASAITSRCWPSTGSRPRARASPTAARRPRCGSRSSPTSPASCWSPSSTIPARRSGGVRRRHRRRRVRRLGRDRPVRRRRRAGRPDPSTRAVHDARHAVYRGLYPALRAV